MIIGVEAKDDNLLISYYDKNGKIAYITKRLADHEKFNWVEADKPSIYKNWDGKYIKSERSDPKWLSRTRVEELIIEKLTDEEKGLIYNMDNMPKRDYVDIEIKLTGDDFPYPDKVKMPVGMISFCNEQGVNYVLSIMDSEEHPDGLSQDEISKMEKDVMEYFHKVKPKEDKDLAILRQNFTIKFKQFKTEEELLTFYFHKIVPKQSLLTGWNFLDFDWQYLMNRCNKLGIKPYEYMVSDKTFNKRYKLPFHLGIVDYMQFFIDPSYKPYKVVENTTLDHISEITLGTRKLEHEYKSMREFQEKDVYKFTMYNVIDNILVKMIDDKLGLLDVAFSFANIAEIEINKIMSPVHITEVLMCREFLKSNLRMLKKPWSNASPEDETYEGAYVMPPVPGYYEYITCYDFKSMYPNIQIQFNISPDAYIGKIGMIKTSGSEIKTKNKTLFRGDMDSVSRIILKRLYNARIKTQAEVKELKFG